MQVPETRYALVDPTVSVAYQVMGDGPIDLVYLQGFASKVDLNRNHEPLARFLHDLEDHDQLNVKKHRK